MKKLLFFLSLIYFVQVSAQIKSDSVSKSTPWSLGIVDGPGIGLTARLYLKNNKFISAGILVNQLKFYIGYSTPLPYGYPQNFYNSFHHFYLIPLYYNWLSQINNTRYYVGLGAEALYWRDSPSLAPSETRVKYWIGAKAGITFKCKSKYSFYIESNLRETNIVVSYPGIINIRSVGYYPYLNFEINFGLLINFRNAK